MTYAELGLDPSNKKMFAEGLRATMDGAEAIHFDLNGMNGLTGKDGVLTGSVGNNSLGSTNWELRTIWDNPELAAKTVFHLNGATYTYEEVKVLLGLK